MDNLDEINILKAQVEMVKAIRTSKLDKSNQDELMDIVFDCEKDADGDFEIYINRATSMMLERLRWLYEM